MRDVVHRFVDAGVGIEVGSKLHADGFAPRNDARRGAIVTEMFGSVEGHVFQEVGQSALAWLFKDASHALCDVEIGHARFFGVVANEVG